MANISKFATAEGTVRIALSPQKVFLFFSANHIWLETFVTEGQFVLRKITESYEDPASLYFAMFKKRRASNSPELNIREL